MCTIESRGSLEDWKEVKLREERPDEGWIFSAEGDVLPVPGSACTSTGGCGGFRRRLEGSRNDGGHGGGQRVKVLLPAASAVDTSPSWIRGTRKFMRGRTGGRSLL